MTYLSYVDIAGTLLPLGYDPSHFWDVTAGYTSPVREWVVHKDVAAAVVTMLGTKTGADREVSLFYGDPLDALSVDRVIFLGVCAARNPQKRTLLFADVRWYFTRAILLMDINETRRVGETHLIGDGLVATPDVAVTVKYTSYTTTGSPPAPYTWEVSKEQVLKYLTLARHGRPLLLYTTDTRQPTSPVIAPQVLQNTASDGFGYMGLARAIEAIPGAGIYVDTTGIIHVYDATPGAEIATINTLPKSLMGYGDVVLMDMSNLRPVPSSHSWRVYVDLEIEMVLKYDITQTVSANYPYLTPVLQVTDIKLTIPAGPWGPGGAMVAARDVGQGTWISQDEAFAAWGGGQFFAQGLPQLTDDIVARNWWSGSLLNYSYNATGVRDPVWAMRIGELLRCYRTVFRVNPGFWDRIRHAWAVRAAIWDSATGQRAPSPVYSNYATIPVERLAAAVWTYFSDNVLTSYPVSGNISGGQPSGFRVNLYDEELGIIEIDRSNAARFPGQQAIAPSPVIDTKRAQLIGGVDGTFPQEAAKQQLIPASQWKLATVLSLSPGSPNDLRRCFEIQVSMLDALVTAGLPADTPMTGYAPDQEVRSQLVDARVPYIDENLTINLQALGALDAVDDIGSDDPVTALVPINRSSELKPLANAIAAAQLLSWLDHYEGSKTIAMTSASQQLAPLGSIDRVIHKVSAARATTTIHCTPKATTVRAVDLLSGPARNFILKQIAGAR